MTFKLFIHLLKVVTFTSGMPCETILQEYGSNNNKHVKFAFWHDIKPVERCIK